jgi:hypothetical protein
MPRSTSILSSSVTIPPQQLRTQRTVNFLSLYFQNNPPCPLLFSLTSSTCERSNVKACNSLIPSHLPPLVLSCLSFQHSFLLFSIACSLFLQNAGGADLKLLPVAKACFRKRGLQRQKPHTQTRRAGAQAEACATGKEAKSGSLGCARDDKSFLAESGSAEQGLAWPALALY